MKKRKLWIVLTSLFLILSIVSVVIMSLSQKGNDLVTDAGMSTGLQNYSLAYDETTGTTYVGAYQNALVAYDKDNNELWRFETNGPVHEMKVDAAQGLLVVGCEDQNVYLLGLQDGSLKNTINVQRRIYGVDISSDGSKIAVASATNVNKSNILVYTMDGEQVSNIQFTSQVKSVAFTSDDNLIYINKAGEIGKVDQQGAELALVNSKYELAQMVKIPGTSNLAIADVNAEYKVIDENLQTLQEGKATGETVIGNAIGASQNGDYIFLGTEEGMVYVFDKNGNQIFSDRVTDSTVTNIIPLADSVYITGQADYVKSIPTSSLTSTVLLASLGSVFSILLVVGIIGFLFCLIMSVAPLRRLGKRFVRAVWLHKTAYILLVPTFVLILIFNYYPMFTALTRAFTNWSRTNYDWSEIQFVGFDNFVQAFTEGYFLVGLGNLAIMLIAAFLKVLTVPVLIAWLVFSMSKSRQKTIFRFLFVLPMVVPGIVSTLMWQQIYDPSIGLLNQILKVFGLPGNTSWLGNENTALGAIIFMGFPWVNAFAFLVYYGGLIDIDASLFEAAKVDGSTRWKDFRYIEMPLIWQQIKLMLILTFIGTLQDYNSIFILTKGGPGSATYVPGLELYYNATRFGRYGYACALGVMLFIAIMIGTILQMRVKSADEQ